MHVRRFFGLMLQRYQRLGFTARHALQLLVMTTTAITVAGGIVMWIVNRAAYPTVGSGLWWALQTVTTVGYGDHLPTNGAGRAVAVVVMLTGIGFLTVATAAITAAFLESARRRMAAGEPDDLQRQVALLREEIAQLRTSLGNASPDR